MIFLRSAQREFAQTAAAVFVVLFAILITTQLVRLLGQAAGGRIASEAVAALLGFSALNYLPVLLSLTLFVAILLSLARAYRDSEMAIWFSSGLPLTAWIRPVLRFALPVVAVIAVLALFLSPWALSKRAEYQDRMDQRDDVARVSPGTFNESARGDRVFFIESLTDAAGEEIGVGNVFVSSMHHGRLGVIVAAGGHTEIAPNGDKFVVLTDGRRYETTAGSAEYRILEFARYAIRTETQESRGSVLNHKQLSSLELLRNPSAVNRGELAWRLGVPLSALLLALLAIPLSFVNPRAGRTNNLILALLTFMTYSNLLSVSQAWVAQGRLSFAVGAGAVHLAMFVALVLLFRWRLATAASWRRGR